MNKTLRNSLIVLAAIVGAAALVLVGMNFGRVYWSPMGDWPGSMMAGFQSFDENGQTYGMGPGMMGFYDQSGAYGFMGSGMMGGAMMNPGMMGFDMMGSGMMGTYGSNPLLGVEPLPLTEAEDALQNYLDALGNDDLTIGEVMIFDNHAYAQLIEESTGIGAMEVLVDPVTRAVSPEFGPNMMWNLKYSPMAGSGMMGMMSGLGHSSQNGGMGGMMDSKPTDDLPTEMPVTPGEAVQIAQRYLDAYLAGAEADEEADPFYGYYTLHITKDDSTVGMLSVNGYTSEVFLHIWHGNLLEMSETH
jgi:hypothetical protein